jgi:hypothetical protein
LSGGTEENHNNLGQNRGSLWYLQKSLSLISCLYCVHNLVCRCPTDTTARSAQSVAVMQTVVIFCRCEDKISLRFYCGVRSVWEKEVYTGLYPRNVRRRLASFNADKGKWEGSMRKGDALGAEDKTLFALLNVTKWESTANYWRKRLKESDKTVRICWIGELTWIFV